MATSDVSFTYDLFKVYGSLKWKNYVEGKSANLEIFLKEEFIKMTFGLEAKSMHIFEGN